MHTQGIQPVPELLLLAFDTLYIQCLCVCGGGGGSNEHCLLLALLSLVSNYLQVIYS